MVFYLCVSIMSQQLSTKVAHTSYVLNVARFAIEQGMDQQQLENMDNESVIVYLTQIKGVGRWTAEMLPYLWRWKN